MLDIRRLEILQRFAVLDSITATASDLGYSASAISQQLSTLEREAGVALIERTAHSATLTGAGRELAEHAVAVLNAVEIAQSRMKARASSISGEIEVSCIPGLAVQLAPELANLQEEHADLFVIARETDSVTAAIAVLERRCDLAVVDDWTVQKSPPASGLVEVQLRREPVLLALRTDQLPFSVSRPVPVGALRQLAQDRTWLCAPEGQLSRVAGDGWLAAAGIEPGRRWEFEGLHVLASLVAAGAGVSLLPVSVISDQPGLVGVPLRPRLHRRVIALIRGSQGPDPALTSCLDAARRALAMPPKQRISSDR